MKNIDNTIKGLSNQQIMLLFLPGLIFFSSCEEFVDVDPPRSEIISETVFNSDNTAISAMSGIYAEMISTANSFTSADMEHFTGLASDELLTVSSSATHQEFASNDLSITNGTNTGSFWGASYRYILNANKMLEGLENNNALTDSVRSVLQGEARFIRAFSHFYLVNLYGSVPLVLTTDFEINNTLSKSLEEVVYDQIINDLLESEILLKTGFSFGREERVRPNRGTAQALLARVFLYTRNWSQAEEYATRVISNSEDYSLEDDLNRVFLANSREAIWQLQLTEPPQIRTPQAFLFIRNAAPSGSQGVFLREELYNTFEPGDNRQVNWVSTIVEGSDIFHYSFKYQNVTEVLAEYSMILRLAEQYLIRAEARAQQGNIQGAQEDLNIIRNRAGLDDTPANDPSSLLAAIEQERRIELFTEWGHRWLDLKRTNRADEVLSLLPGKNWQATDVLFPIPESEIDNNPNLLPQNL